jgi:hypothetical protein
MNEKFKQVDERFDKFGRITGYSYLGVDKIPHDYTERVKDFLHAEIELAEKKRDEIADSDCRSVFRQGFIEGARELVERLNNKMTIRIKQNVFPHCIDTDDIEQALAELESGNKGEK